MGKLVFFLFVADLSLMAEAQSSHKMHNSLLFFSKQTQHYQDKAS